MVGKVCDSVSNPIVKNPTSIGLVLPEFSVNNISSFSNMSLLNTSVPTMVTVSPSCVIEPSLLTLFNAKSLACLNLGKNASSSFTPLF